LRLGAVAHLAIGHGQSTSNTAILTAEGSRSPVPIAISRFSQP
jgi:hypothetical protein